MKLAPLLLLVACAGIRGTHPPEIAFPHASPAWDIPASPDLKLAVISRPPTADEYGAQLAALRSDGEVVHETRRLFDVDFIHPTFFRFANRTLLLADYGSEDTYGILAWSFEQGRVRDLGEIDVALQDDSEYDLFTGDSGGTARVELRDGAYIIRIRGPLLENPRGKDERVIAKRGETATFAETNGHFVNVR